VRLLIIGGTGFLSGTFAREACQAGHAVTTLTRGRRPVSPGVEALVADRSETPAVAAALGERSFDAVIDCIGFRLEDAAQDLRLFAGRAAHLVFISTDFVYGGEPRRLPLLEDSPTQALNAYGRNKRECEELLLREGPARGLSVTILRPPHILGAGSQLGTGSLQGRDPMLLSRLRQGAPVVLLDGGALLIQPVAATDVARAALAAVCTRDRDSARATAAVYNVAGPDAVTTRGYYERVAQIVRGELHVLSLPSSLWVAARPERAPFAQHRVYSTAALTRNTGFQPSVSLDSMLRETIEALERSGATTAYIADPVEAALTARLVAAEADLTRLLAPPE
jgi:nucleoside-diphosphate-sugar epimerase